MCRRLTHAPVVACAVAVCALLLASAQPARATLIVVPNASFQNPDVADNAFTDTNSTPNAVPNWTFSGGKTTGGIVSAGVFDPGVSDYSVAGGNNTALPGAAEGGQSAYIYLDQDTNTIPETLTGSLTSAPLTLIQSNTLYTLTVALGRGIGIHTGPVTLELVAADFPLASLPIAADAMPANTFTNFVLQFATFEDYPFEGLELSARITHTYGGAGAVSLDLDNVRFQFDPVPEPGSAVALLAMGAVLPTVRRRRR
jgi:hypothetical protein